MFLWSCSFIIIIVYVTQMSLQPNIIILRSYSIYLLSIAIMFLYSTIFIPTKSLHFYFYQLHLLFIIIT